MSAAEFRAALKTLGLRQSWLAERLGVSVSTVNRWATGALPVAPYMPFVLELLRDRQVAALLHERARTRDRLDHGL
jgi:DNA-binding transcriptional regulator YdaS (Cro superfamily)